MLPPIVGQNIAAGKFFIWNTLQKPPGSDLLMHLLCLWVPAQKKTQKPPGSNLLLHMLSSLCTSSASKGKDHASKRSPHTLLLRHPWMSTQKANVWSQKKLQAMRRSPPRIQTRLLPRYFQGRAPCSEKSYQGRGECLKNVNVVTFYSWKAVDV